MSEGEARVGKYGGGGGVVVGFSVSPVCVDSLEYHSNMIADAVKKVIKVGKVSSERFQGLSTIRCGS